MTSGRHSSFRFGPFHLDLREQRLDSPGGSVRLTPKVFAVLALLVEHAGHLVDKDVLVRAVWPDTFVEEGAVNRSISILRKALAEHDPGRTYIETVPKRGYRFVAPVLPGVGEASGRGWFSSTRRLVAVAAAALLLVAGVPYVGYRFAKPEPDEAGVQPGSHRQVTFTGKEGAASISPDGRRLAYVSNDRPERALMIQELAAGGRPLEIHGAPEISHLRWSPDGSQLLIWTRGPEINGLHVVPAHGGTLRAISHGYYTGCWSPDGLSIAVATYLTGKILLFDTAGRSKRTLTLKGDHWSILDLDWSGPRDRLLFVSHDRQGQYTIWTIAPDGSDQRKVRSFSREIPSVRWAPDGTSVYFFQRDNQTFSLHRLPIEPGAPDAATTSSVLLSGLETDGYFDLAADATRLVYSRAPYHSNLRVLDTTTGGTRELTTGTSLLERPRVSPDGGTVVFNVGHESHANLFTMPLTGGATSQLTFLNGLNTGGAWSPDGRRIVFGSTHGGDTRIWTIPAAGGTPQPLKTASSVSPNLGTAWSPGRQILYQRAGNQTYGAIDLETSTEHLLTPQEMPGWMFAPTYSPDLRHIAVMWNRKDGRGIWVIDATGDRRHRAVYRSTAASVLPIAWSADSAWIYVVEGKAGSARGTTSFLGETIADATIKKISSDGTMVDTVAQLAGDEIGTVTMTPDGRHFVFPVFTSRSDVWIVEGFARR